jgi:4-diphosphocytidyl-2-C-methyl-D-erythritol kinase
VSGEDGARPTLALDAWAKINLWLHVIGRRDDGYHLLDSLVVFAGVGDTVEVRHAHALADGEVALTVSGPFARDLPTDGGNLVVRAAQRLASVLVAPPPAAAIHLIKRLPPASGIGGGSADAAATLRALACLWRVSIPEEMLASLALSLGADVPVCLAGFPAFVGGIGESIAPAPPLPAAWLVLANPRVAVPTAEVFRRRDGDFSAPAPFAEPPGDAAALALSLAHRSNDLTLPALAHAPVIGDVLAALARLDGALLARMSGSGATCFALFATAAAARAGARVLAAEKPQWWVADAPVLRG